MAEKRIPLALYVHVPFCERKCQYCDFLSGTADEETKNTYVEALVEECRCWKDKLEHYEIRSIFIGGGTPTCLSARQLARLGEGISYIWDGKQSASIEFTVEANPGTLSEQKIQVLRSMGVNRVSLGLQSSNDSELQRLGRIHDYADFLSSFRLLRDAGFQNINVDIMAALPGQTVESYQETLQRVVSLHPEHISAYSLIVEEETPFYAQWEEGTLSLPDEDTEREMDRLTERFLAEHGYRRYEISNYALTDRECRHNRTYWQMGQYLGLGLGAASYFGGERFQNTAELSDYCSKRPEAHIVTRHTLSPQEEREEYVFLRLRLCEGISMRAYEERFGVSFREQYAAVLPKYLENHLLEEDCTHDRIYFTRRGRDVSNVILADFLLD